MVFEKAIKSAVEFLVNFFYLFIDLFIPNLCLICDEKLYKSKFVVCKKCIEKLPEISNKDMIEFEEKNLMKDISYNFYFSKYKFEEGNDFQKLIHEIKYKKNSKTAVQLGMELGKELLKNPWFLEIDFLIPVPIHHLRKAERGGYNQSSKICEGIRKITNKLYNDRLIIRKSYTTTQTLLNASERSQNLKGVFKIKNPEKLNGKSIAIVDDVCTTGSTIIELIKELNKNGVNEISIITLAMVNYSK